MKSKLMLILALLAMGQATNAQEKRYIETMVSDTIRLKPIQFEYKLTIGETSYSYDYSNLQGYADTLNTSTSLVELEEVLSRAKFNYILSDNDDYSLLSRDKGKSALTVTVKSNAELAKLKKLTEDLKGVSGKITSTDYESPTPYIDAMFKRLYTKALAEATSLAKITGNTVGTMTSATEVTDQTGSYMDWIMQMSRSSYYNEFTGLDADKYKVYTRKFSFRFELK
jgi:hypothetical protein